MRKLVSLFIILAFLFAFGCAKEEPAPMDIPDITEPAPVMNPIEPEEEEPVVVAPEPEETEETAPELIGSRVTGTEVEPEEQELPEAVEEIQLTEEKTMTVDGVLLTEKNVSVGATLFWKNHDSWPHLLAVESGKGFDTVRHSQSPRLQEGEVWNYTFSDEGTFLVRDIFSGTMRMTVTVE